MGVYVDADDARIHIVNIMTFDDDDNQPHEMAGDTKTAAAGIVQTNWQVIHIMAGYADRDRHVPA